MKLEINDSTTVKQLEDEFKKEVGATLRVYDGRSEAAKDARLVSLGAKEGTFEFGTNRTVGSFCEAVLKNLNLKVKVKTADDWVTVLDGLTLNSVKDLPKQTTKKVMEDFIGYQKNNKIKEESNLNTKEEIKIDIPEDYKDIPLVDIDFMEIAITEDSFERGDGISVLFHGYEDEDKEAIVYAQPEPYLYLIDKAVALTKNKLPEEEEKTLFLSKTIDIYNPKNTLADLEEFSDCIGVALNEFFDGGNKHYYSYDWNDHCGSDKIIFRVNLDGLSSIFMAYEDGGIEIADIDNAQFDALTRIATVNAFKSEYDENIEVMPYETKGKKNIINADGINIFSDCDEIYELSEGLLKVDKNEKSGFINSKGEIVIPFEYGICDIGDEFSEGLVPVKINDKWGYMDKNRKIIIEPQFYYACSFKDGKARVDKDEERFYIDTAGNRLEDYYR